MAAGATDAAVEQRHQGEDEAQQDAAHAGGHLQPRQRRRHLAVILARPRLQLPHPQSKRLLKSKHVNTEPFQNKSAGWMLESHLDKEDKQGDVCADGDPDIQLDRLDLEAGQEAGGHGNLAAVDGAKDGEDEEGEDDVDPDLGPEPELSVQWFVQREDVQPGEEEERGHGQRSRDRGQEAEPVGAASQAAASSRGGQEPEQRAVRDEDKRGTEEQNNTKLCALYCLLCVL